MTQKPKMRVGGKLDLSVESGDFDILIAGGGLVGMAAALILARQLGNRRIALVETRALPSKIKSEAYNPSFDSRSTALSASSLDIFSDLEVLPGIIKHATEIREVHVSDRGHFGKISFNVEENNAKKLGYVVENSWLGEKLYESVLECANIDVISPAFVERVQCVAGGVELSLKTTSSVQENIEQDQDSIRESVEGTGGKSDNFSPSSEKRVISSELLILADGADSNLSRQLGIATLSQNYNQHALIANVDFVKAHNGVAFERFTARGPMALLPLGESPNSNRSALVWTHDDTDIQHALAMPDKSFLSELQSTFGYKLGRFTCVSKRSSYPLALSLAQEQVRSSVVLLGNAAHALHPVAGQGFNLALRDCAALARQLMTANASSENLGKLSGLQEYLKSQEKDQWLTTTISDSFNTIFSNEQLFWQGGRNAALLIMSSIPAAKKQFFSQMMGMSGRRLRLGQKVR